MGKQELVEPGDFRWDDWESLYETDGEGGSLKRRLERQWGVLALLDQQLVAGKITIEQYRARCREMVDATAVAQQEGGVAAQDLVGTVGEPAEW